MHKLHRPVVLTVLLIASGAPLSAADDAASAASATSAGLPAVAPSGAQAGPFAEASKLPYGLPPFDAIKDADFEPAFEAGMREQRGQVDAIARDPQPAGFDNTILALERSGGTLDRVSKVFFNLDASNTDPQIQQIRQRMAPKLAAHQDEIFLNPDVFARVEAVWRRRSELGLDPESVQLVQRYYTLFVRAGARLGAPEQDELRKLDQRLAELATRFQQNVLKATNEGAVVVDDGADLDGLSPEQIAAAAEAAKSRKLEHKWLLPLQNTTIQPALAELKNRSLRERIFRASIRRADGGEADNDGVIAELVKLRAQRARLLGYPDHAAYVLADEGAGTTTAVNRMLSGLAAAAVAKARRDATGLQQLIDAQARAAHAPAFKLRAWDWAYYAAQARKARFDLDESAVKPYFEMDRVLRDGVFYAAHELYGLTFKRRDDLPRYHPDVQIYEVFDADGSGLALLLTDLYARDSKRGGAWMNEFVGQSRLEGTRPVVIINLNVSKPAPGQPTLLTFDETTTMFHEFGHALHGMLSSVNFPLLHGTQTPRDFVEYPSQFNEMWAREPAVLAHYARHVGTGEPMPSALLDKVLAAQKFDQGYATTEYLAAAILDQSWHQIDPVHAPPAAQVMAFEKAALQRAHVDVEAVPPRYHSTYFSHVFDVGYDANYYAYIWSEVLARDTEQWFHRHGGLNRANGDFFRAKLLSRGRTAEPKQLFEEFYGAPADIGPLLEHRGLTLKELPSSR
jgi:peptidyl-dipeptidase Dcp